jgi:3-hydroxyisobutyrate dehydrogenase-like beta-hydroxyacid dehydrogenase
MGAAVGAALARQGRRVLWASEGRSAATLTRAESAGLEDAGSVAELVGSSDVILSVCPPHAALEVARSAHDFPGVYVDANAISPATTKEVGAAVAGQFVDGGIVGPPPRQADTTRLYLSGPAAATIAELFDGSAVDARVVSAEIGAASALKLAYAAWSKGTAALLLAIRELARAEGIEDQLVAEWELSQPGLLERSRAAARSAEAKSWRWVAEMEEIAATFRAAGLPGGFHEAAAEIYRAVAAETAHT